MLKKYKIIAVFIGAWCLLASLCHAQDISVQAEVSSRKVALGSAIKFTITIHGENNVAPVKLPPMDSFDVEYLGPTTRMSFVNGRKSTSKSFVYSLFPLKEGQFEIPTVNVIVAGRTYTLRSIPIEVVAAGRQTTDASQPNRPATMQEKLFVALKIPKSEVYLNEPVPIKIMLFDSGPFTQNVQLPELNNIGFMLGEYKQPQQYQQIINGIRHQIVEFNNTIFPTREGKLQLGPVKLLCTIAVNNTSRNSRSGLEGSIFNDDFFQFFFSIVNRQDR